MEFNSVFSIPNFTKPLNFNNIPNVNIGSSIHIDNQISNEFAGCNHITKFGLNLNRTSTEGLPGGLHTEEWLLNNDAIEYNLQRFLNEPSDGGYFVFPHQNSNISPRYEWHSLINQLIATGLNEVKSQLKHGFTFEEFKDQKTKQLVCQNKALNSEVVRLRNRMSDMKSRERFNNNILKKSGADIKAAREMVRIANEEKSKAIEDLQVTIKRAEHAERQLKQVETVKFELDKLQVSFDKVVKEKNNEYADRVRAELYFEFLRTSIPRIFYKAIKSEAVMGPFNRLIDAAISVGRLEMLFALSASMNIPDPLPLHVMEVFDEDCIHKYEVARKELKELKVPYIEDIGGSVPHSPMSISYMSP